MQKGVVEELRNEGGELLEAWGGWGGGVFLKELSKKPKEKTTTWVCLGLVWSLEVQNQDILNASQKLNKNIV